MIGSFLLFLDCDDDLPPLYSCHRPSPSPHPSRDFPQDHLDFGLGIGIAKALVNLVVGRGRVGYQSVSKNI